MVANTPIEWTDHTFNPWWGCTKVSAACDNCYAEALSRRFGYSIWGHSNSRRSMSEKHWQGPIAWNAQAERSGRRRRVFCASMADVFEERNDLNKWRERLWRLIEETPALDWQLLTKRPHAVMRQITWSNGSWPSNVRIGTTVENQSEASKRIRHLADIPAPVRFLSCEPLLGPIDLSEWFNQGLIDWVIAGGESGPRARTFDPEWALTLKRDCSAADVPFFFKQWGTYRSNPLIKELPLDVVKQLDLPAYGKGGALIDGTLERSFPA